MKFRSTSKSARELISDPEPATEGECGGGRPREHPQAEVADVQEP
jgi:hypothetical protein